MIRSPAITRNHLGRCTQSLPPSAGHPSMEGTSFVVTVVDEAAQCAEPSLLIALRRGCSQCIMVRGVRDGEAPWG